MKCLRARLWPITSIQAIYLVLACPFHNSIGSVQKSEIIASTQVALSYISSMSILALIPARGGSKSIPRKNIKYLAGKPLIVWTIEASQKAECFDQIVVSTDDEEIAEVSRSYGASIPFMRPRRLAQDDTPGVSPVLHALEILPKFEWVMVLQPTSPLRTASDIQHSIAFCNDSKSSSLVSVTQASEHPYWMFTMDNKGLLKNAIPENNDVSRRQDLPSLYTLNGAIYLAHRQWLFRHKTLRGPDTVGYVMPNERSVDIDTPLDWELAEHLLSKIKSGNQ